MGISSCRQWVILIVVGRTSYKEVARYNCCGLVRTADISGVCCFVRASIVDELVVQEFFKALRPAQLDALDAILAAQQVEQAQLNVNGKNSCNAPGMRCI